MNPFEWLVQKHSVARQLLVRVLAFYFAVALLLLVGDVTVQYYSVKQEVYEELRLIHKSFSPGLARALWDINTEQVQSFFGGMRSLPSVVGGEIRDEAGETLCIGGTVLDRSEGAISIGRDGEHRAAGGLTDVFSYGAAIHFGQDSDVQKVGEAILYSSSDVVLRRLLLSVGLTLVEVLLSAAALCLIFVCLFTRLLGRPLGVLTAAVGELDPDNAEDFSVDVGTSARNELKILEESFNTMARNLSKDRTELLLYRRQLEEQVAERTAELTRLIAASDEKAAEESSLDSLTGRLQEELSTTKVAERALDSMVEFLEAPVAVLYVLEDDGRLHRRAEHALPPEAEPSASFALGSGSIGRVARSRQMSILDPGDQAWSVTFGIGSTPPRQVVTCPLVASDNLAGVVEFYLFSQLTEPQSKWLSKATEVTATGLRFAQ